MKWLAKRKKIMENHLRWFGYEGSGPTQTISDYAPLNKKKGDKNRHDEMLDY